MDDMPAYTIRQSSRAKRIRIAVYQGGEVVVVKPKGISSIQVSAFVRSKKDWIEASINGLKGKENPDLDTNSEYHYRLHKPDARALVERKLAQWNTFYQFSYNRIEIKRMTSRWGSCSAQKVLCFNYKIVFLSEELQDYLIVHELCHLVEMNHSDRFWAHVARAIPEYKRLSKQINSKD